MLRHLVYHAQLAWAPGTTRSTSPGCTSATSTLRSRNVTFCWRGISGSRDESETSPGSTSTAWFGWALRSRTRACEVSRFATTSRYFPGIFRGAGRQSAGRYEQRGGDFYDRHEEAFILLRRVAVTHVEWFIRAGFYFPSRLKKQNIYIYSLIGSEYRTSAKNRTTIIETSTGNDNFVASPSTLQYLHCSSRR